MLHLPHRFFCCLASVSSPPPGVGWTSAPLLLFFPMLVTFGGDVVNLRRKRMVRAQSVPTRHVRVESEKGVGGGVGLGCPDVEVRKGAWVPLCAQTCEWSRRHRRPNADVRPDIRALVRPIC
jgi:hypothetical protein